MLSSKRELLGRKDGDLFTGKTEIGGPGISRLDDRREADDAGREIQMTHVAAVQYNVLQHDLFRLVLI